MNRRENPEEGTGEEAGIRSMREELEEMRGGRSRRKESRRKKRYE